MKKTFVLISLLFVFVNITFSQEYYRFFADVSVKYKNDKSEGSLTMAKLYYDKNISKIVQEVYFPDKAILVITDSASYRIENYKAIKTANYDPKLNFLKNTMFHLLLENKLNTYGLEHSAFKKTQVEKDKGMIFTTWMPPDKLKDMIGKVVIGTKDQMLKAVLFFGKDDNLLSKQLFKKPKLIDGLMVPTEILQIFYNPDGTEKAYQMTTFKNIKINEAGKDNIYNYPLYFK